MLTRIALGLLIATLAPAALRAQPSAPQSPLTELSLEQLGSLEVTTVTKEPAEVWRSAAAISVLTQDDIRRSGATTLPELLRHVPGVQVSRLDSDHWAIGVRGLTSAFSKSLLVLIDGRSVYTPLFGGVFWQVQDTLLEDIDRIEIIRGPGGSIWGANAVNGVINVITKNSRDTVGTLASVGGGNVDQGRFGVRYGGRRGASLSYRVYASGFQRAPEHHTDTHLFDEWSIGQAGFRIDTSHAESDRFSLHGDVYKGSAGDVTGIGTFFPPEQLVVEGPDHVDGFNVVGRWQHNFTDGGDFQLQTYFDRTSHNAVHFGETRNTFDVDALYHRRVLKRHNVALGAGARVSPSDFRMRVPTLALTPEDDTQNLASAFAQDEITLANDTLWLTLGSKLSHDGDSGLEIQPSARLLWRPNARQTIWTAVSRSVRTPSRLETDILLTDFLLANPLAYLRLSGSPDFRSERLIGVEVGYRRLIGSQLYLDVTAFHNDYDNLAGFGAGTVTVESNPRPFLLFALPYVNAIKGTTDGFELAPDWRPASWLRLRGSYALLTIDMRNRPGNTDDANVAVYEQTSPRHLGFVEGSLMLPGRIEIDHSYRFSGRLRSHDVPRYVTADVRVGWPITSSLTLSVTGQNLLEAEHIEYFRDEIAPIGIRRSVYASATWRR